MKNRSASQPERIRPAPSILRDGAAKIDLDHHDQAMRRFQLLMVEPDEYDRPGQATIDKSRTDQPNSKPADTPSSRDSVTDTQGQSTHEDASQASSKLDDGTPGDAILQMMQTVKGEAGPDGDVWSAKPLGELVHEVAGRLLVAAGGESGREIRIQIKQAVLPGTEVRLSENAGKLQIKFVTDSPQSLQRIGRQLDALQSQFNERLPSYNINVSVEAGGDHSGSAGDGRSRGHRPFWQEEASDEDTLDQRA